MKSPLVNGKLVAKNYDSRLYIRQADGIKRGDPSYVMSRSSLVAFLKCPSKWIRIGETKDEHTDATEWGTLIDCLLFERERFSERFAIHPDTYPHTKAATKKSPEIVTNKRWNNGADFCKDWREAQGDKICISRNDYESAEAAILRIKEDESIAAVLASSDFQVYATAEYHDEDTGLIIPVKALIDIVPPKRSLKDFKTARNADPKKWNRVVYERDYHVQSSMFLDVYNAATGEEREVFQHVVQESSAPFEISKHILADEFIQMGRNKYLEALRLYAKCIAYKKWPTYDELPGDKINGWNITQPEAYMIECIDPDWENEKAA